MFRYTIPLLQARLEELAIEDAEEKSKATREASLSELDPDDKKNTNKEDGDARQGQRKSKVKKKNKDKRKPRELKVFYTGYCSVSFLWQLHLSKATHV